MKARFNHDPDAVLRRRLAIWIGDLGRPEPTPADPEPSAVARPVSRRPAVAARALREASIDLNERAGRELAAVQPVLARLLGVESQNPYVTLRRASPTELTERVRAVLRESDSLRPLWTASADRPLARVVAALPAASATRFAPLTADEALPGALRGPARRPATGAARSVDLVALRVRAVLGRLLRADDPDLAAAVSAHPDPGLLRSAVLAATTWGVGAPIASRRRMTVPGYPRTSLDDASWRAAWPGASELGAEPAAFAERIAAHGPLLPASWTAGNWPLLWARAHQRPTSDAPARR